MALADAGPGLVFIGHRQLHRIDPAFAPDDAAAADRGVEYRKMMAGHGWLQILLPQIVSLMLGRNLGLEIVAIHPNPEGDWGCPTKNTRISPRICHLPGLTR